MSRLDALLFSRVGLSMASGSLPRNDTRNLCAQVRQHIVEFEVEVATYGFQ